jgi:cobalt/nickel transport protein
MAKNWVLLVSGLGMSITAVLLLVPHASQYPDGLDRVAQDLEFEHRARGQSLPSRQYFEEYRWQGLADPEGTMVGGMVGMGICCGLAWAVGSLLQGRSGE